jgi:hypothetical protein
MGSMRGKDPHEADDTGHDETKRCRGEIPALTERLGGDSAQPREPHQLTQQTPDIIASATIGGPHEIEQPTSRRERGDVDRRHHRHVGDRHGYRNEPTQREDTEGGERNRQDGEEPGMNHVEGSRRGTKSEPRGPTCRRVEQGSDRGQEDDHAERRGRLRPGEIRAEQRGGNQRGDGDAGRGGNGVQPENPPKSAVEEQRREHGHDDVGQKRSEVHGA